MSDQLDDWGDELFDPAAWVSLNEALLEVTRHKSGGYEAAKSDIVALVADGQLDIRCEKFREEADLGSVNWSILAGLKAHPNQRSSGFRASRQRVSDPLELRRDFWSRSDGWQIEPGRIDWMLGVIVGVRPSSLDCPAGAVDPVHLTRRAAFGCLIKSSSLPIPMVQSKAGTACSTKGSKSTTNGCSDIKRPARRKYDDSAFFKKFESMIDDGLISKFCGPDVRGTQARIEARYKEFFMDKIGDHPSDSHARRRVVDIMNLWRSRV